jgi:acyl transferase domain-containing protein
MDICHVVRNQRAFLSGQVSHHFGLRGPSVSVDTVCAAFNDACRMATGECRRYCGGVHVLLDPKGQCNPFLTDGGGYQVNTVVRRALVSS